jgi:hypothetical protein
MAIISFSQWSLRHKIVISLLGSLLTVDLAFSFLSLPESHRRNRAGGSRVPRLADTEPVQMIIAAKGDRQTIRELILAVY